MAVTTAKVAGMDENRTHQGHLNSALRTVLKTADLASASVLRCPRTMKSRELGSADVR